MLPLHHTSFIGLSRLSELRNFCVQLVPHVYPSVRWYESLRFVLWAGVEPAFTSKSYPNLFAEGFEPTSLYFASSTSRLTDACTHYTMLLRLKTCASTNSATKASVGTLPHLKIWFTASPHEFMLYARIYRVLAFLILKLRHNHTLSCS